VIFVTYCTQDVHVGNTVRNYGGSVNPNWNHRGAANVKIALDYLKAQFPSPDKVLVSGCSAGAIAAGIYGPEIAAYYNSASPSTTVDVIADAFVVATTDHFVRSEASNWGAGACKLLDLAEESGGALWDATEDYTLPFWEGVKTRVTANGGGYTAISSSFSDSVQANFYQLQGENEEVEYRHEMAARILARADKPDTSFIYSGSEHCVAALSTAFGAEGAFPEDAAFKTWVAALFDDGSAIPAAYACASCTAANAPGCDNVAGSGKLMDNCAVCGLPEDSTCTNPGEPAWVAACTDPTPSPVTTDPTPSPVTTPSCSSISTWEDARCLEACDGSRCNKKCADKCSSECGCNDAGPGPAPAPVNVPVNVPVNEPVSPPTGVCGGNKAPCGGPSDCCSENCKNGQCKGG